LVRKFLMSPLRGWGINIDVLFYINVIPSGFLIRIWRVKLV
jgi:hypothetical protein